MELCTSFDGGPYLGAGRRHLPANQCEPWVVHGRVLSLVFPPSTHVPPSAARANSSPIRSESVAAELAQEYMCKGVGGI